MAGDLFRSDKEHLSDLLADVGKGVIQLPDFQRNWVWPVDNIRNLLSSVSLGYPIGAIMTLQTGGEIRFRERPVEGAEESARLKAQRLILDGQQRLTSLYQALTGHSPIATHDAKNRPVRGWLYFDIHACADIDGHREDAVVFVTEDRRMAEFPTADHEYAAHLFPSSHVFDYDDWGDGYRENLANKERWTAFRKEVLETIKNFLVPIIELKDTAPRGAVCQIFERVNTGAVPLNVFELLTAAYAADEFQLREDWEKRRADMSDGLHRVLDDVSETDFLQALALRATYARREAAISADNDPRTAPRIGCRREDMLNHLSLDDYQRYAPEVTDAFRRAARFLYGQGFVDGRFLPYGSQLIPLAAIFATLGKLADPFPAQVRLERWFWCGVFGELYSGAIESRFAADLPQVVGWIRGGEEPKTIADAQFTSSRLLTMRTKNSAAYKGLFALLIKSGARDWVSGEAAAIGNHFGDTHDHHHVFPQKWCTQNGLKADRFNSIINKTPLSAYANRSIGAKAPSVYVKELATHANDISGHVESHLINVGALLRDDFEAFWTAREDALLDQIENAMGKAVHRE